MRRPPILNYRPNQMKCYKVILNNQVDEIGGHGYVGFPLDYIERQYPHNRIVKVTTHHLYSMMDKNHRNK